MPFTYVDLLGSGSVWSYPMSAIVYAHQTRYQSVHILETGNGRALFTDGNLQSHHSDEFAYHELLVHPAIFNAMQPVRDVLHIGGGEGAGLREILKHNSVASVSHIDLDEELVAICRRWLPQWSNGAFEDLRVHTEYEDALLWVDRLAMSGVRAVYDCIIVDLPEPEEQPDGSITDHCYSLPFFRQLKLLLRPGGTLSTHLGPVHYANYGAFLRVFSLLAQTFTYATPHICPEVRWGFAVAAGHQLPFGRVLDEDEPGKLVNIFANKPPVLNAPLRYYNQGLHRFLGALPTYLDDAISFAVTAEWYYANRVLRMAGRIPAAETSGFWKQPTASMREKLQPEEK